jgi:tRNA threonylcarbamoyl adenosine modification protein (Sua5/YciO/YrdC/YwlC family)
MGSTALPHLPVSGVPEATVISDAIERLARGEVIALPTETVYGLAVRADDADALARLAALKGRAPGQGFTWHAPDASAVAEAALPHFIGRLAERYWPGPLTLVVADLRGPAVPRALALDGWTGVRVPAHAGARALLAAAPFPVAASSANRTGASPAVDAAGVRAAFGVAEVPLVLDGGRARLAESSTVAAIGPRRFELLREGIISASDLRRAGGLTLTFVCTGNTCRSPMAEGLARHALAARLGVGVADIARFGFEVSSAGVHAGPGTPASEQAVRVLARRGIDLSRHASTPVSSPSQLRHILAADRVYCLTAGHRDALLALLPPGKGEHVSLLDPEGGDVPDPYGGPLETYTATAEALERMIEARLTADWV